MAKPNYAFSKRQRDIAKKQKKEEKRARKTAGNDDQPQEAQDVQLDSTSDDNVTETGTE